MSKIYLKYDSLEYVLNDSSLSSIIQEYIDHVIFIKSNTKKYNIINDCYICSTVITNIIYEYTHEIIELKGGGSSNLAYDRSVLWFGNIPKYSINISIINHYINVSTTSTHTSRIFGIDIDVCMFYVYNYYMKRYYGITNYFNCSCNNDDTRIIYAENVIVILKENDISGIEILNHRDFKQMIIIIKCITNGIKKYYSKKNIKLTL